MEEKTEYVKIEYAGTSVIVKEMDDAQQYIDDLKGENIKVSKVMLTDDEFEKLDEFMGF